MCDLQKASISKRIAAWIFDMMMILILFSFAAAAISWATGISNYTTEFNEVRNEYITKYGIDPSVPEQDLTDEQKQNFIEAEKEFQKDERAIRSFAMMLNLSLVVLTSSKAAVIWVSIIVFLVSQRRKVGDRNGT